MPKARTGIAGLDEITHGGLPAARPTLICGGPGCGKTVLAMEFLVRGATEWNEPGLFVSFEETSAQLIGDFRSFGFDVEGLIERKQLKIAFVELNRADIAESGAFSLDALFIRLEQAIASIGARRVVLDTMDNIFALLADTSYLRKEISRLFQWLKDRGVTTCITGERGIEELTRHGLEEYVSDCVILLDHRVADQTSKRRLRVVKYRGSAHAADEFPFLIGETGFSVLPITSVNLDHGAERARVSTGVAGLDGMLGGQGLYKGSSVLLTGSSGTGKSSLVAAFAEASCRRGERCQYFSFEESASQMARNMGSLGMDLGRWLEAGTLDIQAFRPSFRGLEEHLVAIAHETEKFQPSTVVLDPITNFVAVGGFGEIKSMLTRVLDLLKRRAITVLMTALTTGAGGFDHAEFHVSSMVDTWFSLSLDKHRQSRRRALRIIKARGTEHSHETWEYRMSTDGILLEPMLPEDE